MNRFLASMFFTLGFTFCTPQLPPQLSSQEQQKQQKNQQLLAREQERQERLADLSQHVRDQYDELRSRPLSQQLEYLRTHMQGTIVNDANLGNSYLCREREEHFDVFGAPDALILLMAEVQALSKNELTGEREDPIPGLLIAVREEGDLLGRSNKQLDSASLSAQEFCEEYKQELFKPREQYAENFKKSNTFFEEHPEASETLKARARALLQIDISILEHLSPRTYFPEPATGQGLLFSYEIPEEGMMHRAAYVFPSTKEPEKGSIYIFANADMKYQIGKLSNDHARRYLGKKLVLVISDVLKKVLFTRALEEYSSEDRKVLLGQD